MGKEPLQEGTRAIGRRQEPLGGDKSHWEDTRAITGGDKSHWEETRAIGGVGKEPQVDYIQLFSSMDLHV